MNNRNLLIFCLIFVRLSAMDPSIFEPSRSPIGSPIGMSESTYVYTYLNNARIYIDNEQLEDLAGAFAVLERSIQAMHNKYLQANFLLNLTELVIEAIHRYPQFEPNVNPRALLLQTNEGFVSKHNMPLFYFLTGYFATHPASTYYCYDSIMRSGNFIFLSPTQQAHIHAWFASYFAAITVNAQQAAFAKTSCQQAYQQRNLLNPFMRCAIEDLHARMNPTASPLPTSPAWRPTELSLTGLTLQMP